MVDFLAKEGLVPSKDAGRAVIEAVKGFYEEKLRETGEVSLSGIGKLKVVKRSSRRMRHPTTKEVFELPEGEEIRASVSKTFKEAVLREVRDPSP